MFAIVIGIIILVAVGLNSIMTGIISTKQKDVNDRNALRASAIMAAIAFVFVLILMFYAYKKAESGGSGGLSGLAKYAALAE